MERTNAMRVNLPEKIDLISIDTSWTKQEKIIPNAVKNLKEKGRIIALIKPHYEVGKTNLDQHLARQIAEQITDKFKKLGLKTKGPITSPIEGKSGGNSEFLVYAC